MKKASLATLLLALGAGTAAAQPFPLRGSDTLLIFTEELIDICTPNIDPATELFYQGGGSGLGAGEMAASRQDIAPMSRFMNANTNECSRFGTNLGQGCQVALDAVAINAEDENQTPDAGECNTLRYSGALTVRADANAAGNTTIDCGGAGLCTNHQNGADGTPGTADDTEDYTFSDWRDVLRIIYGGQHAHVTATACSLSNPAASVVADRNCASDVRYTLANNWTNLFQEGSTCNSTDPDACTQLKHAFRRDDASGTTEVFLEALGLPPFQSGSRASLTIRPQRTFCNGLENEEEDPIRRDCDLQHPSGTTGLQNLCNPTRAALRGAKHDTPPDPVNSYASTVSMWFGGPTTDPAGAVGDLGLVLPMMIPEASNHPFGEARCSNLPNRGSFALAAMPSSPPVPPLPASSRLCPNGTARAGGLCFWPLQAGSTPSAPDFECTANKLNRPTSGFDIDGRGYNLIPRNPNGTLKTVERVNPNTDAVYQRNVTYATYRLHELTVLNGGTYTTAPGGTPLQTGTDGVGCQSDDATHQIGCLVGASPCSIGFAGLASIDVDPQPQKGLALAARNAAGYGAVFPTKANVRRLNDSLVTCTPGTPGQQLDGRYPIARGLWFNSLKGFEGADGVPGNFDNIVNTRREQDLIKCACDRHFADVAANDSGFVTNTDLAPTDCTAASPTWVGPASDICDTPIRTCP